MNKKNTYKLVQGHILIHSFQLQGLYVWHVHVWCECQIYPGGETATKTIVVASTETDMTMFDDDESRQLNKQLNNRNAQNEKYFHQSSLEMWEYKHFFWVKDSSTLSVMLLSFCIYWPDIQTSFALNGLKEFLYMLTTYELISIPRWFFLFSSKEVWWHRKGRLEDW